MESGGKLNMTEGHECRLSKHTMQSDTNVSSPQEWISCSEL